MEWIIYIGVGLLVLIFIKIALGNYVIAKENILEGGFRSKYRAIADYTSLVYGMSLMHDDGRSFSFGKPMRDCNGSLGKLIIGLKLDMMNKPLMHSKFISSSGTAYEGISVMAESIKSFEEVEKCLHISIKKLIDDSIIPHGAFKRVSEDEE